MLLKKESAEDKDWEVFKSYFSEVHNNFDNKINTEKFWKSPYNLRDNIILSNPHPALLKTGDRNLLTYITEAIRHREEGASPDVAIF